MHFLISNTSVTVQVICFCFGVWLCVRVLGYEPNSVGVGGLVGVLAIAAGSLVDRMLKDYLE